MHPTREKMMVRNTGTIVLHFTLLCIYVYIIQCFFKIMQFRFFYDNNLSVGIQDTETLVSESRRIFSYRNRLCHWYGNVVGSNIMLRRARAGTLRLDL